MRVNSISFSHVAIGRYKTREDTFVITGWSLMIIKLNTDISPSTYFNDKSVQNPSKIQQNKTFRYNITITQIQQIQVHHVFIISRQSSLHCQWNRKTGRTTKTKCNSSSQNWKRGSKDLDRIEYALGTIGKALILTDYSVDEQKDLDKLEEFRELHGKDWWGLLDKSIDSLKKCHTEEESVAACSKSLQVNSIKGKASSISLLRLTASSVRPCSISCWYFLYWLTQIRIVGVLLVMFGCR